VSVDEKQELQLTDELLEFAKARALHEAGRHCPPWVDRQDVVQQVMLGLLAKPPKYDLSKGVSEKTLIHTVVRRIVLKYVAREKKRAGRFMQPPWRKTAGKLDEDETPEYELPVELSRGGPPAEKKSINRRVELLSKSSTTDDVLEFIDNEESRALCRLVIECGGNVSEAARRLGLSEGTVRYRLRLLAPKLRAAGFRPFPDEEDA